MLVLTEACHKHIPLRTVDREIIMNAFELLPRAKNKINDTLSTPRTAQSEMEVISQF